MWSPVWSPVMGPDAELPAWIVNGRVFALMCIVQLKMLQRATENKQAEQHLMELSQTCRTVSHGAANAIMGASLVLM